MLTVENLNQYYGSSQTLRDLSFEVPAGACTALLGRNGVGKTTLLRCLMGVVPIARGSIRFEGHELSALPPFQRVKLGIGYVPQGREIFPRLTVQENLLMGLASKAAGGRAQADAGAAGRRPLRRPATAARDRPRPRDAAQASDPR
jgi:urea transport system ATP-binding protein